MQLLVGFYIIDENAGKGYIKEVKEYYNKNKEEIPDALNVLNSFKYIFYGEGFYLFGIKIHISNGVSLRIEDYEIEINKAKSIIKKFLNVTSNIIIIG